MKASDGVEVWCEEGIPYLRSARWVLVAILVAEFGLLFWKYDHFFNGDSLFYFSHRIESWRDLAVKFSGPDHLWQYRPLTYVIFSFCLYPLFGSEPLGYNVFPLLVHMVNTVLVYRILRYFLHSRDGALIGAFFFGVHPVAFYVTYGVAFLPDFSYSLFYLLSLGLFLKYCNKEKPVHRFAALAFFVLALFCKEAAITLPPVLLLVACSHHARASTTRNPVALGTVLCNALRKTSPFLIVSVGYLAFHWISKSGEVYPPDRSHSYYSEFSPSSLRLKYKYLKWAFGFPDGLVFDFQGWSNYVVATGILIFLISLATTVCRGLRRKNFEIWFGASWFLLTLIPVLFLRNVTMHHNLYIPVIGLALLVGLWLSGTYRRVARVNLGGARLIVAGFVLLMVGASAMHNLRAAEESWIAEASAVAKSSLDDLKNQRPRLSGESILYIVNDSPRDLRWFYDAGTLFRLFYQDPSLKVHFAERGDILPGELQSTAEVIVLVYDGERLRDVSLTEEDSVEQED